MNETAEQVLCFRRELLKPYSNQTVFFDSFLWNRILENLVCLPRSLAEYDNHFKQLVAYNIIRAGKLYLTYRRTEKGAESRLWQKYSLGIGGHINVDDQAQMLLFSLNQEKSMGFFTQTVWREISEEIRLPRRVLGEPELLCFINDDSNEVGQVHFGLVWLLEIGKPSTIKGKKGLTQLRFYNIESLKAKWESFETWSRHIIDYISRNYAL